MAHHQHHGATSDTTSTGHILSVSTGMPSISEDEFAAEADEPPEHPTQVFAKTKPAALLRRQSLLSKGLHTDSESHGDDEVRHSAGLGQEPYRTSTCSTHSSRSTADLTSDDGLTSPGTRASTPSSPPPSAGFFARSFLSYKFPHKLPFLSRTTTDVSKTPPPISPTASEPVVEAKLGRKRCISFACGPKSNSGAEKLTSPTSATLDKSADGPKRACMIRFACASMMRDSSIKPTANNGLPRASRHLSPPPPLLLKSPSPAPSQRRSHRDSDTTIKNESPKTARKASSIKMHRESSVGSDIVQPEAIRFQEPVSFGGDVDDWVKESTAYRCRLTVSDTLKKENDIRLLGEECEEEALEEEDAEDDEVFANDDSPNEAFSDDDPSDGGFQTDDEEGFAESDDESGSGSDYEWWAPRRSLKAPSARPLGMFRPVTHRTASESSLDSASGSHRRRRLPRQPRTRPVAIRPTTPDLPDSTDFVCGTLDEDRPLEQAYIVGIAQRKAAKHKAMPQDIDPTFPTSDPDIENDDADEDEEDEISVEIAEESDQHIFMHGQLENLHGDDRRGRRISKGKKASPHNSPKRLRSPPAPTKRGPVHRSPPPRPLFGRSPRRLRSPPPPSHRLTSPPNSRRGSLVGLPTSRGFLGHRPQLTHTASLPRSPAPFRRRMQPCTNGQPSCHRAQSDGEDDILAPDETYTRGAIDIVQGLEHKRLRRRQKFYEKYIRKEEKKEKERRQRQPQPGRGAERMRQVGVECALYRGKRVLSI